MKIHTPFAAVERRVLRRVNENLETIFEFSRWREINESIVAGVIAAGEAGDAPPTVLRKLRSTLRLISTPRFGSPMMN
jgi:hypothetical protein